MLCETHLRLIWQCQWVRQPPLSIGLSTFHLHPPSFSPPPRHPSALNTSVSVMDERNVDERIVGFASGSNYEVQELIGLSFSSRLICASRCSMAHDLPPISSLKVRVRTELCGASLPLLCAMSNLLIVSIVRRCTYRPGERLRSSALRPSTIQCSASAPSAKSNSSVTSTTKTSSPSSTSFTLHL